MRTIKGMYQQYASNTLGNLAKFFKATNFTTTFATTTSSTTANIELNQNGLSVSRL